MRITVVCSLFAMCFMHSKSASLPDIFSNLPKLPQLPSQLPELPFQLPQLPSQLPELPFQLPQLPGMEGMQNFHETMRGIMKPFGCMELIPGPKVTIPYFECLMKIATDIKAENNKVSLPSFKKTLEKFTQCRLDKYGLIENEKFSMELYQNFHESVTYIVSNPEDLQMMNDAIMVCTDTVDIADLTPVRAAMALEKCIVGETIDRCTESKGAESVGPVLPTVFALNSLFDDNTDCDSVKANQTVIDEYGTCVKKEETSFEEDSTEMMSFSSSPKENIDNFVEFFKKIPEIECIIELGEEYILAKDGVSNFPALADYVDNLSGWSSPELKNKVTDKIRECGNVDATETWKRYMEFGSCFLPAYADTCGLQNELSSEVMFPLLNEKFMSSTINRILQKLDLSSL